MGYKNVTRNSNKIIINPLSEYETDLLLNKILKNFCLKTLKYYFEDLDSGEFPFREEALKLW